MIARTWRGATRAADAFLVDRDLHVDHFEVVYASDIAAPDAAGGA